MIRYLSSKENFAAMAASVGLCVIVRFVFGITSEDLVWWLTVLPASVFFGIMASSAYKIRHLS